jgi:hypothetical protein
MHRTILTIKRKHPQIHWTSNIDNLIEIDFDWSMMIDTCVDLCQRQWFANLDSAIIVFKIKWCSIRTYCKCIHLAATNQSMVYSVEWCLTSLSDSTSDIRPSISRHLSRKQYRNLPVETIAASEPFHVIHPEKVIIRYWRSTSVTDYHIDETIDMNLDWHTDHRRCITNGSHSTIIVGEQMTD